ncbi:hypothetical protein ABZT47_28650 [Sphaerisporangium sp. NPDC005289]|uniref:hypothetical protein n=1 Tax=Sphaerisporangium sp. NPDC005289 TaxID=3155247 RepID=UPI0033B7BCE3
MDSVDAGRLLALATDFTVIPGRSGLSAEYRRLVNRYVTEASFKMLIDGLLEGAECEATYASETEGLIVRADADSPWCWPAASGDLPWNTKKYRGEEAAFQRAGRLLVIPALLAYIAPSAVELDDLMTDPTLLPPPVPVRELEKLIRDFAEHLEAEDPGLDGNEYPIWWHWLQASGESSTGRAAPKTTSYMVNDVLQFLRERGLLTRVSESGTDTVYQPRRRLIFHYTDLLIDGLFTDLQQFAARQQADAPPGTWGEALADDSFSNDESED